MIFIGWAVLGIVIGMVGSEVLRAKKPKLIGKVEGAAKQFVDSVWSEESGDEEAREKEGADNTSR